MALSSNFVQQMYVAYFGRPADPGGLTYFTQFDENTLVQVFANSAESKALYGSVSGTSAINAIYQNLFNRAGDTAGVTYWSNLINSGQISASAAALAILRGAINDDATTIANKVTAANTFTAHVDTTAEIAGYFGTASAAAGRAYLQGVTNSTTLASAQAGVDQSVFIATGGSNPGGVAGQNFPLTAGADTVAGSGGNDTITSSTAGFFGTGDAIDGGAGTDTLTVSGEATITGAGITVTNVENANLSATGAIALDTTGWTGLTSLTTSDAGNGAHAVTAATGVAINATTSGLASGTVSIDGGAAVTANVTGATTGTVTVGGSTAPTGAVNLTVAGTAVAARGAIIVNGGSTVTVNQTTANDPNTTATLGTVTVNGRATTTAVTVTNTAAATVDTLVTGVTDNTVTVNDVNGGSASTQQGKITSVSISGYTTATVKDNALTTLTLANGSGDITVNNASSLTSGRVTTLNVSLNNITGGTLKDSNVYTTLNITTTGQDSTLANITDAVLTGVNVSGSKTLTLTSTAGLTALQTLKVSDSAAVVGNFSAINVSAIDASATSGKNVITIDGDKTTFSGGSGVDTVTLAAAIPTKVINMGGGDDVLDATAITTGTLTAPIGGGTGTDVLKLNATYAATATGFAGNVSGFEQLTLTALTNQSINLTSLQTDGFATVETAAGNGATLTNLASGSTLSLTGAGTSYTVANTAFTAGINDVLKVKLASSSGTAVGFGTLTADNVETINITTADNQAVPSGSFNDTFSAANNFAKTITVGGNAGLTLTATSTALTSVDASGITLGGFTWTSGALAGAATVKGSAAGTNAVDLHSATAAITYTGGTGADTVTVNGSANSITVGTGNDKVVITSATGSSSSVFTSITGMTHAGGDTLDLSAVNNANTFAGTAVTIVPGDFAATLNAAATDVAGTTNTLHWFQFGGDTYVVSDKSDATTFQAGTDMVVKLAGVVDLSAGVTATGGVVTL